MRKVGASGKDTGRPIIHHQSAPDNAATTRTSHASGATRDDGEGDDDMRFLLMGLRALVGSHAAP
jgi:hypothetical protein